MNGEHDGVAQTVLETAQFAESRMTSKRGEDVGRPLTSIKTRVDDEVTDTVCDETVECRITRHSSQTVEPIGVRRWIVSAVAVDERHPVKRRHVLEALLISRKNV